MSTSPTVRRPSERPLPPQFLRSINFYTHCFCLLSLSTSPIKSNVTSKRGQFWSGRAVYESDWNKRTRTGTEIRKGTILLNRLMITYSTSTCNGTLCTKLTTNHQSHTVKRLHQLHNSLVPAMNLDEEKGGITCAGDEVFVAGFFSSLQRKYRILASKQSRTAHL